MAAEDYHCEGVRRWILKGLHAATSTGMLGEFEKSGFAVPRWQADRLAGLTASASSEPEREQIVREAQRLLLPSGAVSSPAFRRYMAAVNEIEQA